ncbi:I78 family peptidase inhibitor [uncultured Ruegeria sp.]|uniref:I78 family peptidase inhibitor n=1 Tax=uncultured Ruegeria sp. TaxID=259304 RepID=UPI00344F5268
MPPAPPAADGFGACDTDAYRSSIGVDIRETGLTEGQLLRIVRPGDLMTGDFRPVRVNLVLTAEDRIARAFCG